jgi:hypothetical protein
MALIGRYSDPEQVVNVLRPTQISGSRKAPAGNFLPSIPAVPPVACFVRRSKSARSSLLRSHFAVFTPQISTLPLNVLPSASAACILDTCQYLHTGVFIRAEMK